MDFTSFILQQLSHMHTHKYTHTLKLIYMCMYTPHIKVRNAYATSIFQIKILEHRNTNKEIAFDSKVTTMTLGIPNSLVRMIELYFFLLLALTVVSS